MQQVSSPMPPASAKTKQPLDIVVKFALGVFVASFALIWGGMYLSRPDRSIPPYTVGSQSSHVVATDVPLGTPDHQIEKLLNRFRKIGHETRDFGPMKIYPTTPGDPVSRYRHMLIYVFDDHRRTDPEVLAKYLAGEAAIVNDYERSMRGYYRLRDQDEEGGIGPLLKNGQVTSDTRIIFRGRVTDALPIDAEPEQGIAISPL
jgi:hypothetical protein